MKRTLSAVLALLCLVSLLSGCEQSEQYDRPPEPSAPLISPANISSSLSPEQSSQLQGAADQRGALAFDQQQFNVGFLETEQASYCCTPIPGAVNYYLFVRPKGYDQFLPLCARPNCLHNNEDCSAYLALPFLGYMDGRIYAVTDNLFGTGQAVVSMLADGTDRREVAEIPTVQRPDGGAYGPNGEVFHENRLILHYFAGLDLPLEQQIATIRILDLKTGQITEPFQDFLQPGVSPGFMIQPAGSKIFVECAFRDPSGAEDYWMISMDMDTGEVQKLYQTDQIWEYTVDETTLRYYVRGQGLIDLDLATGSTTVKTLPVPDTVYVARTDEDYIYAFADANNMQSAMNRDHTIYILDRDLQLVDELYLGQNVVPRYVDHEYIYLGNNDFYSYSIPYRLDKSRIGTGTLELEANG